MATVTRYEFVADKKGAMWDTVLYVPTIIALISVASKLWFSGNQPFTYLLVFLTTLIALIGFNRVAKTRLMLIGSAPVALSVSKSSVSVELKNGGTIELVKELRFFADMAGRSFGLSGIDGKGKRQSQVFHKGQFGSAAKFDDAKAYLRVFK